MGRGTQVWLSSIIFLSIVTAVGASGQKEVRASLVGSQDRQAAPAFSLADWSGKVVTLAGLRGKPVVLNLWATECGGCRLELPTFVQMHRKYAGKGLAVVGVSFDIMYEDLKSAAEGWARVKPFAAAKGMTYTILLDNKTVEDAYHVTALPATYLIDRSGRVAATYIGVVDAGDLESDIKVLLNER